MLTLEGFYKDGKVEIAALPAPVGPSRVLVTFLEPVERDLASRGISPEQTADLRARLSTFAEDWDRPEMDIYDVD